MADQLVQRIAEGDFELFENLRGLLGSGGQMADIDRLRKVRGPLMLLDRNGDGKLDAEEREPAIDIVLKRGAFDRLGTVGAD